MSGWLSKLGDVCVILLFIYLFFHADGMAVVYSAARENGELLLFFFFFF